MSKIVFETSLGKFIGQEYLITLDELSFAGPSRQIGCVMFHLSFPYHSHFDEPVPVEFDYNFDLLRLKNEDFICISCISR